MTTKGITSVQVSDSAQQGLLPRGPVRLREAKELPSSRTQRDAVILSNLSGFRGRILSRAEMMEHDTLWRDLGIQNQLTRYFIDVEPVKKAVKRRKPIKSNKAKRYAR